MMSGLCLEWIGPFLIRERRYLTKKHFSMLKSIMAEIKMKTLDTGMSYFG